MKPAWWMAIPIFLIGAAVGISVGDHAMHKLATQDIAAFQDLQGRFEQLAALQKEAVHKWQGCSARWNDAASTGTVIFEPEFNPSQAIGPIGVLKSIVIGKQVALEPGVRWVIPFKVEPQVADEIRGAKYGWIDKDGKFQGWFTPRRVE